MFAPLAAIRRNSRTEWLIPIVLGTLLALVCYVVLPMMGVGVFSGLLSHKNMAIFSILLLGGALYWYYVDYVTARPGLFLCGVLLFLPWLDFLSQVLQEMGIKTYKTAIISAAILLPIIPLARGRLKSIVAQLPWMKYMFLYNAILVFYFLFFQEHILDQRSNAGMNSLGFYFLQGQVFHLGVMLVNVVIALAVSSYSRFFGSFVKTITLNVLILGLIGIAAYPFNLFTLDDQNVRREMSLFPHPTIFADYMAVCLLFLCGVYFLHFFYKKSRGMEIALIVTVGLGSVAMFLTVTKASIIAYLFSLTVLFILSFSSPRYFKRLIQTLIIVPALAFSLLYATQIYTGRDILGNFTNRLAGMESLNWRNRVADYLLYDTTPQSVLVGNGMSAAKCKMSLFEGMNFDKESPGKYTKVVHVHNGYVAQFYDYGLLGLTPYFVLFWILIATSARILNTPREHPGRSLDHAIVALVSYFLIASGFNAILETLSVPFWLLLSVLYCRRIQLPKHLVAQSGALPG